MIKNVVKAHFWQWQLKALLALAYLLTHFLISSPDTASVHAKPIASTKANASNSNSKLGAEAYITLHFPSQELGQYCLLRPGKTYAYDMPVTPFRPLKGTVNIPPNSLMAVKLAYFGHDNTALLNVIPVPMMRDLFLSKMEVGNADFQNLLRFTDLVSLDMSGIDVDDKGTQNLRKLTKLQKLDIGFCPIGIATVAEVSNLKELKRLHLASSPLGEQVGPLLAKLKKLEVLHLSTTRVTDKCISDLSVLKELQELNLAHNNVTDKSIDTILKLKHISRLNLADTKMTYAGFMKLNQLPELRYLLLKMSQLTTEQQKALRKQLPKVIFEEGTKARDFDLEIFDPLH